MHYCIKYSYWQVVFVDSGDCSQSNLLRIFALLHAVCLGADLNTDIYINTCNMLQWPRTLDKREYLVIIRDNFC